MRENTLVSKLGTNHADEIVSVDTPHTTIQLPTDDLTEEVLTSMGLRYTRDEDNDPCLLIPGDKIPFDMLCWFLTNEHHIFTLYCRVFPPIPKSKWHAAVSLCNEYATQYRFGRFQLRISAEQSESTLCFVAQLDLSDGTTVAFLKTFIASHLSSACAFLGEPHVQKLLVPASPRQRRTTTNRKGVPTPQK